MNRWSIQNTASVNVDFNFELNRVFGYNFVKPEKQIKWITFHFENILWFDINILYLKEKRGDTYLFWLLGVMVNYVKLTPILFKASIAFTAFCNKETHFKTVSIHVETWNKIY